MDSSAGSRQCPTALDYFLRGWSAVAAVAMVAGLVSWAYKSRKRKRNGDGYQQLNADDDNEYKRLYEHEKVLKEDALRRLSKIMSSRLSDGNPDIANLSDEKRPTRLAEEYSELYDNAWSDAFDCINNAHDNEEKIEFLRKILEKCFAWCSSRSQLQLQQLSQVLSFCSTKSDKTGVKAVSRDFLKAFKDERKLLAKETAENISYEAFVDVKQHFLSTPWKEDIQAKPVEVYCRQCAELCWMMEVQDPPLYIDFSTRDRQMYKAYTRSGKQIDFVVWPPLLLFQGGQLMAKGVAQFKKQ